MTSWADRRRDAQAMFDNERMEAEAVDCPFCGQPRGRTCLNSANGRTLTMPAHADRIKAAREAS